MAEWFVKVFIEVDVGEETVTKWTVFRRHQTEPLGDIVKGMIPPLSPDTLLNVCVQAYETEGRLLRNRLMGEGSTPAGPSAGFAILVDDLNDLNEFRVQLSESVQQ